MTEGVGDGALDTERCGWQSEGGTQQCTLQQRHQEKAHVWGDLPARAPVDEEDASDNEKWA
jgi:hypothetical protein